jgi:hypothetical protein
MRLLLDEGNRGIGDARPLGQLALREAGPLAHRFQARADAKI